MKPSSPLLTQPRFLGIDYSRTRIQKSVDTINFVFYASRQILSEPTHYCLKNDFEEFETSLERIESLIEPKCLNQLQRSILQYSCQGLSYAEIAQIVNYDLGYVKDTGYNLWKLLSKTFAVKVTKKNLPFVLKRCLKR